MKRKRKMPMHFVAKFQKSRFCFVSRVPTQLLHLPLLTETNDQLFSRKCFHHHHHHHHWRNSPFWAKAFFRSFCQLSLFLAAFLQFLFPSFLASSVTPSPPSQFRPTPLSSSFYHCNEDSSCRTLFLHTNSTSCPF